MFVADQVGLQRLVRKSRLYFLLPLFGILSVIALMQTAPVAAAPSVAPCNVYSVGSAGRWTDLNGCIERIFLSGRFVEDGNAYGEWQGVAIRVQRDGHSYTRNNKGAWQFVRLLSMPDQDNDGIPDGEDECVTQPETINGLYDEDGCPDNIHTLTTFTSNELNRYWRTIFWQNELRYTPPRAVKGYWGRGANEYNAFYSGFTHSIHYDLNLLNDTLLIGDFAPVYVLSHEWGHLIQNNLDLMEGRYNILIELQADCFAGVYTAHLDELGLLKEGDLDESLAIAYYAGDADDVAWFAEHAHGSGQQRVSAFLNGFYNGFNVCLLGY